MLYGWTQKYIYKFTINATVRLLHPRSEDSQGEETFLAPSADKQTRNHDIECSNHHPSLSVLLLRPDFTLVANLDKIFIKFSPMFTNKRALSCCSLLKLKWLLMTSWQIIANVPYKIGRAWMIELRWCLPSFSNMGPMKFQKLSKLAKNVSFKDKILGTKNWGQLLNVPIKIIKN